MGRIMVIDDDEHALVARALQDAGHVVALHAHAWSAVGALVAAGLEPPSVIVVDLDGPHAHGPALVEAVATHPVLATIPVVATTATADTDLGPLPGVFVVLSKPVDVDDLLDAVAAGACRGAAPAPSTAAA